MNQTTLLLNLLTDGVTTGALYALVAIGFSLLWWLSDLIHLAHGAVVIAAGYAGYTAIAVLGLPFWVGIFLAALLAIVLGMLIQQFAYQNMIKKGAGEMGLLTISLGVLISLEYIIVLIYGPEGVRLDAFALRAPIFPGSGYILDAFSLIVIGSVLVIFVALHYFIKYSDTGKRMRAVAANVELAQVLGISTWKVTMIVAALSAALVAPASFVYLHDRGLEPHDAMHIVIMASIVAIVGGRGSLSGAVVAGLIVGVAESIMVWFFAAGWREIMTFALLYIVLLFKPEGLFGESR